MMIFGREFAARTIALIVGLAILVAAAIMVPSCLSKWRSERAQARVDSAQSGAQSNSAADAIGTVTRRGAEETASEDLTRQNERDIRNAEGSSERVKMPAHTAGLAALCKRQAYKDSERCKIFRKEQVR